MMVLQTTFHLRVSLVKVLCQKVKELLMLRLSIIHKKDRDDFFVLKKYKEAILFKNRRTLFKDSNIHDFQTLVDEYSQIWREVAGKDGQTNYEYFMWSGHISHFLIAKETFINSVSKVLRL